MTDGQSSHKKKKGYKTIENFKPVISKNDTDHKVSQIGCLCLSEISPQHNGIDRTAASDKCHIKMKKQVPLSSNKLHDIFLSLIPNRFLPGVPA